MAAIAFEIVGEYMTAYPPTGYTVWGTPELRIMDTASPKFHDIGASVSDDDTSAAVVWLYGTPGDMDSLKAFKTTETYAALKGQAIPSSAWELAANKTTTFGTIDDNKFPTTEAIVESFSAKHYALTGGAADVYTLTLTNPEMTADGLTKGTEIKLNLHITNTGASTLDVNGLTPGAGVKVGAGGVTDVAAAELVTTKIYTLVWDGTNWQTTL